MQTLSENKNGTFLKENKILSSDGTRKSEEKNALCAAKVFFKETYHWDNNVYDVWWHAPGGMHNVCDKHLELVLSFIKQYQPPMIYSFMKHGPCP